MDGNIVFYGMVTLALSIWFIKDTLTFKDGGYFPNKRKGEVGGTGTIIIFMEIIFTLIWGGIFWW